MTSRADPMVLGEKLLALLDEAALSSTYKPALLLALIDRCQERAGHSAASAEAIPVRELAERVVELYWPQTVAYPVSGMVLWQNQGGKQAKIVKRLIDYRAAVGAGERTTLAGLQSGRAWQRLLDDVERSLAEMPIPRLQEPYEPFLYDFGWESDRRGRWTVRGYLASSREVRLLPGVAEALVALAPLMRPFIAQWWTDKAASLNANAIPDAHAMVEFERFLFGRERIGLVRLAGDLFDLQGGECFYCRRHPDRFEVDHFLPWTHSADDGLDNLVVACRRCNNAKRAMLPAAAHVGDWLERGERFSGDLASVAETKRWPRNRERTLSIGRALYLLRSPDERPTWLHPGGTAAARVVALGAQRSELARALG